MVSSPISQALRSNVSHDAMLGQVSIELATATEQRQAIGALDFDGGTSFITSVS